MDGLMDAHAGYGHNSYFAQEMERLGPIVKDRGLVELCVNPDGRVWVELQGDSAMRLSAQTLSQTEMGDLASNIASTGNSTLGRSRPVISGSVLYEGRAVRYQVVAPPVVDHGHSISMRFFSTIPLEAIALKFLHGKEISLGDRRAALGRELKGLVASGDLDAAARFCIAHKLNLIVAGGTSTGKTVLARKLISFVPEHERIITIEEAAELIPTQPNTVTLLSDRDNPLRSTDALLTSALRMRPDRLIVGEVRGAEAMTFLEAINTGHGGSITTLHAETPQLAISRLAIAALKSNLPLTYDNMCAYIANSIDVIVQAGRSSGARGITQFYFPALPDEQDPRI
ncbi:ATPase, T2SS/T4P/T4SS family [Roseinatronobacter monicus]|uniref:Type IV secretion system protein VirB11 n=1 Tax=Roseinatronobacter monicus TaxID=393481 RepID=A0A543K4Y2_9RHOB|nr:type IV secretion system protein VirB11 [Roseinatronobacter monicus]